MCFAHSAARLRGSSGGRASTAAPTTQKWGWIRGTPVQLPCSASAFARKWAHSSSCSPLRASSPSWTMYARGALLRPFGGRTPLVGARPHGQPWKACRLVVVRGLARGVVSFLAAVTLAPVEGSWPKDAGQRMQVRAPVDELPPRLSEGDPLPTATGQTATVARIASKSGVAGPT